MLPDARPRLKHRRFTSPLIEKHLADAALRMRDPELRTLFRNCWPNTLDTTIFDYDLDLKITDHKLCRPRTWVITGDIPACWLRDSSNQVIPYLSALSTPKDRSSPHWFALYRLILGTLYAQAKCILHHPYSNAFIPPSSTVIPGNTDKVHPSPPSNRLGELRVWESKYELDSLISFLDLSVKLAESSGRTDFLHCREWRDAVDLVVNVCRLQQRGTSEESAHLPTPWWGSEKNSHKTEGDPKAGKEQEEKCTPSGQHRRYTKPSSIYRYQRDTNTASETRSLGGLGEPARRCGLIKSAFRPSDDATVFQFSIPSNAFASVSFLRLSDILASHTSTTTTSKEEESLALTSTSLRKLGDEVQEAVWQHGVVEVPSAAGPSKERVFAYEVDGFGSFAIADDANLPSLLSLPWLGFVEYTDPVYSATRKLVLSHRNKWFFTGKIGNGVGGMHIGSGFVWPMSIIVRALTSDDDEEILDCIEQLKRTTAGTGFMHESFHVDDSNNFTRSHFSWVNGLFGELCHHLLNTRPYLL
ncbi:uncharacterized protein P7C70_g16, partial [Phenoliferia sp. Uapishka_3]